MSVIWLQTCAPRVTVSPGSVALDLSEAEWSPGFFTEACVAVVEGVLQHDNTFKATALGFPPVEDPVASKAAAHGLNFFGCVRCE